MKRTLFAAVLLSGFLTCITAAVAADAPADRFAGDIQFCKDRENQVHSVYDDASNDAGQIASFYTQADLPLIKKSTDAVAAKWAEAAAAFAKGDEKAGHDLQLEAAKSGEHFERWNERVRMRVRQAQLAPTEEQYNQSVQGWSARLQPAVGTYMEAQKRASEAYGKLADAITPDADQEKIEALRDDAWAAEVKTDIAHTWIFWTMEDENLHFNPEVTSPELTALNERIAAARKEFADTYWQSKMFQRKIEKLDRTYRQLVAPRGHLVDLAREAAEKAKREGKQ